MPEESKEKDLENELKRLPPKEREKRLKEIKKKEEEELKKIEQLIEKTETEAKEEEAKTVTVLKEKEEGPKEEVPEEEESLEETVQKEKATKEITIGEQRPYGEQLQEQMQDLREGTESVYDKIKQLSDKIRETGYVTKQDKQRIESYRSLIGDINAEYVTDEGLRTNLVRSEYILKELYSPFNQPRKKKKEEDY